MGVGKQSRYQELVKAPNRLPKTTHRNKDEDNPSRRRRRIGLPPHISDKHIRENETLKEQSNDEEENTDEHGDPALPDHRGDPKSKDVHGDAKQEECDEHDTKVGVPESLEPKSVAKGTGNQRGNEALNQIGDKVAEPVNEPGKTHDFHGVPETLLLFADNGVENVDENDHGRAEKEDGTELLDNRVVGRARRDSRPVFQSDADLRGCGEAGGSRNDALVDEFGERKGGGSPDIGAVAGLTGIEPNLVPKVGLTLWRRRNVEHETPRSVVWVLQRVVVDGLGVGHGHHPENRAGQSIRFGRKLPGGLLGNLCVCIRKFGEDRANLRRVGREQEVDTRVIEFRPLERTGSNGNMEPSL